MESLHIVAPSLPGFLLGFSLPLLSTLLSEGLGSSYLPSRRLSSTTFNATPLPCFYGAVPLYKPLPSPGLQVKTDVSTDVKLRQFFGASFFFISVLPLYSPFRAILLISPFSCFDRGAFNVVILTYPATHSWLDRVLLPPVRT